MNDLVADGLITLYIEMNAKDYIDTMTMNPPPLPPVRSQSSRIETSVQSTKPVDPVSLLFFKIVKNNFEMD